MLVVIVVIMIIVVVVIVMVMLLMMMLVLLMMMMLILCLKIVTVVCFASTFHELTRVFPTLCWLGEQIVTLHRSFGVESVYLSECQSYPLVMALDVQEMLRLDADGKAAYSPLEVLEGDVVISNHEVGYWSTRLCHSYPNPLLVKLTRAMWEECDTFTVYGECHWGRAPSVVRSGVVPHVRPSAVNVTVPNNTLCPYPTCTLMHTMHTRHSFARTVAHRILPL
jgi:hypothetical protein